MYGEMLPVKSLNINVAQRFMSEAAPRHDMLLDDLARV